MHLPFVYGYSSLLGVVAHGSRQTQLNGPLHAMDSPPIKFCNMCCAWLPTSAEAAIEEVVVLLVLRLCLFCLFLDRDFHHRIDRWLAWTVRAYEHTPYIRLAPKPSPTLSSPWLNGLQFPFKSLFNSSGDFLPSTCPVSNEFLVSSLRPPGQHAFQTASEPSIPATLFFRSAPFGTHYLYGSSRPSA